MFLWPIAGGFGRSDFVVLYVVQYALHHPGTQSPLYRRPGGPYDERTADAALGLGE
jgi:hypothetical protein